MSILVPIEEIGCAACGMSIFLSKESVSAYRRTGNSFYCPQGHSLSFPDSDAKKLARAREQLTEKDREIARLNSENSSLTYKVAERDRKIKRLSSKKKKS